MQEPIGSGSESFKFDKKDRKEAYRWTPDKHLRFVIVAVALGLRDCKPKHLM